MARNVPMPYTLEDRTGSVNGSDFDDIYDRVFLRVTPYPHSPPTSPNTLAIYMMGRRSARRKDTRHLERYPSVVLEFGQPGSGLGTIHFFQAASSVMSIPMNNYLKRTGIFGGLSSTLSRKFKASDGRDYRWQHKTIDHHEWACLSEEDYIVAHYDLRPPNTVVFGVSGNILTVHEAYSSLCIDVLASLTIMRHIAEHPL